MPALLPPLPPPVTRPAALVGAVADPRAELLPAVAQPAGAPVLAAYAALGAAVVAFVVIVPPGSSCRRAAGHEEPRSGPWRGASRFLTDQRPVDRGAGGRTSTVNAGSHSWVSGPIASA